MVYPHSLVHWGPVCIWKPNLLSVLGDHSNRRCEGQSSHHLSTAMKKIIEIMLHITLLPTVPLTPLRTHKRTHVLLTPLQQSFSLGLQSYLCTRWWKSSVLPYLAAHWRQLKRPSCVQTCMHTAKFNDVTSQVYPAMQSSESALTLSHVCTFSWCSSTNHVTSSMLPLMAAWCKTVRPFCRCKHMHTQSLHHMSCITYTMYVRM